MVTNVAGFEGEEIFKCKGDTNNDIKNLVESFVAKFTSISKKSFAILKFSDIINALDQAVTDEAAYFTAVGKKEPNKSEIKDIKKAFTTWLRQHQKSHV